MAVAVGAVAGAIAEMVGPAQKAADCRDIAVGLGHLLANTPMGSTQCSEVDAGVGIGAVLETVAGMTGGGYLPG